MCRERTGAPLRPGDDGHDPLGRVVLGKREPHQPGGVAAVLAMFALPLLGFAAAYGIHNLGLGLAWSFLIVGAAYLVIAGALGVFALRAFKRVRPPERSIASSKQTVEAIKQTKPHPRAEVKPSPRAEVTDRAALH